MTEKAYRTVFIGNIPYGQSEEQIKEICGTVGQVQSFRPIYDNDTGRPRGYGFVEYADADAAASAVRNLNGYKIDGRELRVDFSKRSDGDDATTGPGASNTGSGASALLQAGGPSASSNGLGLLPPGTELPPGVTCTDAISKTLATLPPPQLLDILSQMKGLVTGDPQKATDLLRQAPQLSYAIFQALLLMGLVDSKLITSAVQQATTEGAGAAPPDMAPTPQPPQPQSQYPPAYNHTPPVAQPPFQPPPQLPPDQVVLLKQVLAMPQSEVDNLQPTERVQVMQLRQQYGGHRF